MTVYYHKKSKLLLVYSFKMPKMPDQPTRADAEAGLAVLEDLLTEFPFVDDVSHSAALSALMSPVARGAYEVVPMHVASAPKRASGKTYLMDLIAAIAIGDRMPVISAGANEEETEKRLGAELMTGQPLISIDNVNGLLKSAALCQIIASPNVNIRILGQSKRVQVRARMVSLFANGKNITVYDDLTRRIIKISLDPKVERPELRQFTSNPFEKILADRGKYVAAVLNICRAYAVAGRPEKTAPLLGFERWSDVVRSALIWLGKPDPVLSMEAAHTEDPVHIELHAMLCVVKDVIGIGRNSRFTMRDVIDICAERTDDFNSTWRYPHFNDAVQTAAGRKRPADTSSLGYWMRSNKGDVIDNLRFASLPSSVVAEWYIEDVTAPERDQPGTWTVLRKARAEADTKSKAAAEQAKAKGERPAPRDDDDDIAF